jgi:hypothetical protein
MPHLFRRRSSLLVSTPTREILQKLFGGRVADRGQSGVPIKDSNRLAGNQTREYGGAYLREAFGYAQLDRPAVGIATRRIPTEIVEV